jgi:hypothetical protein
MLMEVPGGRLGLGQQDHHSKGIAFDSGLLSMEQRVRGRADCILAIWIVRCTSKTTLRIDFGTEMWDVFLQPLWQWQTTAVDHFDLNSMGISNQAEES